ncbi:MAG: cysteine desulfurase family protein [Mycobacterium sp.]
MARASIEQARDQVAALVGVRPRQVVFTSGATEAANAAVWGATRARPSHPVLCAAVEHSSVRDASSHHGHAVTIPVDGMGRLDLAALESLLDEEPALVHCQLGNHEVGTLQPAGQVAALCRERGVLCHVDAAAGAGHLPVHMGDLEADLMSISAHKFGGPKGAGALVMRAGLRIDPFIVGGEQERARRAGMENTPALVGFGAAAEVLGREDRRREEELTARARTARISRLAGKLSGVTVYGDPRDRLPHIVCLGIEGVVAEGVLLGLDQGGIAVHSGSACSSESLAPSPVLEAMGVPPDQSLRVSVGWSTSDEDIAALEEALPTVVKRLRSLGTPPSSGPSTRGLAR